MAKKERSLQSHGLQSRVYVPIIRRIFDAKYTPGAVEVDFTLDDIRDAAEALGIKTRNPADVVYRMRSRTKLPADILAKGFYVLRQIGRGSYRLEQAETTIIELPDDPITQSIDITPLPVRRLLPETLAEIDEQGLLTILSYCKLLDHFTGLQVYRLRSHIRKSVVTVGQAEVDELDVGVALRDDDMPVIFPIEAKAADEPVNRVQICMMVLYSLQYFPGYETRPIVIKLDYNSLIHVLEFNLTTVPREIEVVRSATYSLTLSEQQLKLIKATPAAAKVQHSDE